MVNAVDLVSMFPLVPHIQQGSGLGWLQSCPVLPKAVKVFNPTQAQEVKSVSPAIMTVVRRYVDNQGSYMAEGRAGGHRFVDEIADLSGVDVLEGLNEPTGNDPLSVIQSDAFHLGFIEACVAEGVKPCIHNLSVGNPPDEYVPYLIPSTQAAIDAGGYFGYHGYGASDLLSEETWYANRIRLHIEPIMRSHGLTGYLKVLYTEAGFDYLPGHPLPSGPWRKLVSRGYLTLDGVQQQQLRFANRLMELGVEAAFMYTFWGTDDWEYYDYTYSVAMLDWFKRMWQTYVPPTPPPPPIPDYVVVTPGGSNNYANLRATPNGTDIGDTPRGSRLKVMEKRGGWYRVETWISETVVRPEPVVTPTEAITAIADDAGDSQEDPL